MKKIIQILVVAISVFFVSACASSSDGAKTKSEMSKPKDKGMYVEKKDVSDTSMEKADQTDPSLIEGNLEDNDFKN